MFTTVKFLIYQTYKYATFSIFTYFLNTSFYARKQKLLYRVLAIAILSVRLFVTRVDQSKTVQARIIKSLPSAA